MLDIPLTETEIGDITEPQRFAMGHVTCCVEGMCSVAPEEVQGQALRCQSHATAEILSDMGTALDGEREPDWREIIEEAVGRSVETMLD
jgi:hypothetical protein